MFIRLLAVTVASGGLILAVPSCSTDSERLTAAQRAQLSAAAAKIAESNNGTIRVSGRLIDEQGRPVYGAKLEVTKVRSSATSLDPERERKVYDLGGSDTFDLTFEKVNGVELRPTKKGYYIDRHEFYQHHGEAGERAAQVARGEDPVRRIRTFTDRRLVMQKMGERTVLDRRGGKLLFSSDGTGTIFIYDRSEGPQELRPLNYTRAGYRSVDRISLPSPLPVDGLKVMSSNVGGRIDVRTGTNKNGGTWTYPKQVKIVAFGPNSGLRRHDTPHEQGLMMNKWRLKEAPADGYQKELLLSDKEIEDIMEGRRSFSFYYKLGDKYGRARIDGNALRIENDGASVSVLMELETQPDGTRNLETGE